MVCFLSGAKGWIAEQAVELGCIVFRRDYVGLPTGFVQLPVPSRPARKIQAAPASFQGLACFIFQTLR